MLKAFPKFLMTQRSYGSAFEIIKRGNLYEGEIETLKKSKFIAHIATINHEDDIVQLLKDLKKKNKFAKATHNMYAYRLVDDTGMLKVQKNDDGESGAGKVLLEVLERKKADNILVIVTRWYGGVHLGHDRFRMISKCASSLLETFGYH